MQPHRVPPPYDDKAAPAHLRASLQAAADASPDPGHWHLHHIALAAGPGDFTPNRAPEYAEEHLSPGGPFLEFLAEWLTVDHAAGAVQRGLEAGG